MITIEKPMEESRCCRCCYSKENVLEIMFEAYVDNTATSGTAVALCDKCRKELSEKLRGGEA